MLYVSVYNQNTSVTVGVDQAFNSTEKDMSTFSYLEGHFLPKTILLNVKQMHVHGDICTGFIRVLESLEKP